MVSAQVQPDLPSNPEGEDRSTELQQLTTWFEADQGSVVLVQGRRGVGKDRLAEELTQHATQQSGVAIFESRTPAAGGRSFHPFAEIAHQALAWAEQAGADELIDTIYADLSPVLDYATAENEPGPSLDQKLRFFDAFRRLLTGISHRGRLLAIVHDLERADTDTLELASYLADELFGDPALDPESRGSGILLFLARNDETVSSRTRDALRDMAARGSIRELSLVGLDLEGLRKYVQSPHLLQKLLAASNGLPQEIDALIEALPSNIEELFERKLSNMDSTARSALLALAVSGRSAAARVLAEVTKQPLKEMAKALGELKKDRILSRRIHNGEFQFSFSRRRDMEVCDRSMTHEERCQLHAGWATSLSRETDSSPALLAHHQLHSHDPRNGVSLAIQAAETYAVGGALNSAIQMLEDALPHSQGELRITILNRLAELAPLTGDPRRALRFVEEWKAALSNSERGIALRREAELYNAAGDYDLALAAIGEARQLIHQDELQDRASLEATASEAYYHLSKLSESAQACKEGLKLVAEAKEPLTRLRLSLLNQLGKIALANDDTSSALDYFVETHQLAEQFGLSSEQARALINMGIIQLRRSELKEAEKNFEAGISKAKEGSDLARMAFGYMSVGALYHQGGQLGPAIEAYRECRALFRRLGNRTQLARILSNLGNLYLLCGDINRAEAYNNEALRLAKLSGVERVVGVAAVVDGVILAERREYDRAEARLREGMLLQQKMGSERTVETMVELAELYLRTGDNQRVRETLDEVDGALKRMHAPMLSARSAYLRGCLGAEGEADHGLSYLEQAHKIFGQLNRKLLVRDTELAMARAMYVSGRNEMARLHLKTAEDIQETIANALPEDLRNCFLAARAQQVAAEVAQELSGSKAVGRALFAPAASASERAIRSSQPRNAPTIERKEEWKQRYGNIVGSSPRLYRVFHILDRISHSENTVLINGESGTGKELIAEAIHRNSPRSSGPFVKLNCAALVETLLLSELFGHERGSFTGAHQRKIGRFEMAAGGTIFLDEIGDISPKTQVALLRVLQEKEFERVGGGQTIQMQARIVFATNRNLAQMVQEGTFREDLYYRLKGITIDLPPLRERPEDIVVLSEHFLEQYAQESGSAAKLLSSQAEQLLTSYPWPGNIRELENMLRSVALFAEGDQLSARDFDEYRELFQEAPMLNPANSSLPAAPVAVVKSAPTTPARVPEPEPPVPVAPQVARNPANVATPVPPPAADPLSRIFEEGIPLPEFKKRLQEEAIARALRMTGGNITRAAEVLGMRRPRLSQIINANDDLKTLCQGVSR